MLAYRSSFHVSQPVEEAWRTVSSTMVNWAERKHRKQLGPKGLYALEPNSSIALKSGIKFTIIDSIQQPGDRIFGFQSVEPDGDHKWTSKVLVAGNPKRDDESVVSIIIDAPADKHDPLRPKYAEVPRFVRSMLDQMDCDDCGIHLGNKPRQLDVALIPTLIRELKEDDHHGLVLVAGTPADFPFEPWKEFIADTTKNTVGQSATYVLDVEATNYFNQHVSKYHRVDPGSLRSFVPGADFDDPLDGKRHRFITAKTLADDQLRKAASSIITRRSRAFTNSRPIDRKTRRYNEAYSQLQ
ncbi:Hypothetical protein PROPJV5_2353 [Propionibacterium ruminifibrarum]|uniref:Uncharacterized protein n=1 Tax=Propionibacterium ruminifibrarum TaxID=1962131 RepID=A0A375I793_9ACTN|nr:hypothetical protein [Propionibacterium ruminifibrarum]SPF69401.1 Hypothetical protein PROPJV5_2353 [Propionibacterium ruminifibrarum]